MSIRRSSDLLVAVEGWRPELGGLVRRPGSDDASVRSLVPVAGHMDTDVILRSVRQAVDLKLHSEGSP